MSWGVGHSRGSVPRWLWLWYRPAAAAPIQPVAWDLPYAAGAALKEKKKDATICLSIYQLMDFFLVWTIINKASTNI